MFFWHIIRPQPISAVAQWCTGTGRLISVGLAIRETVVDVLTVRSGVREALQTFGTLERLLTGMKSTMFRQVMFVLESLVAVGNYRQKIKINLLNSLQSNQLYYFIPL